MSNHRGFIGGKVFKPEWWRIGPFLPAFKCLKIIAFSYKQMIIASLTYLMERLLQSKLKALT